MQPKVTAIVPAYNEEVTVGRVVQALKKSRAFADVLVISDGSTDRTAAVAQRAGATVIDLPRNVGKGRAMRRGVQAASTPFVAFFDADVIGLRLQHVHALLGPVLDGTIDMNIGLIDRGSVVTKLMEYLPLISGQRVLRRDVFLKIRVAQLEGYRVESALNAFYTRHDLRVGTVPLQGVTIRKKIEKVGVWKGLVQYIRMWRQVVSALRSA